MDKGWIKLSRKIIDWEYYKYKNPRKPNYVKDIFIHLLLNANHKDVPWHGITIKKGQLVISYENIAKELNFTIQIVRTALKKLLKTKEIVIKSTNEFTLITLCNYSTYQQEQQTNNKRTTNEQQTNNNKQECKELKNEKNKDKHILNKWISENLNFVTKIKTQLTTKNCEKLLESYSIEEIQDVLWQMENTSKIESKYNTVYLTLLNWLKTNYGKRGINEKNVKHSEQNSGVGNPKVNGKRKEKDFESSKGTFFNQ